MTLYHYNVAIVGFALEKFTYSHTEKLSEGAAVVVNLKNKLRNGYIIEILNEQKFPYKIKPVDSLCEPVYNLTIHQTKLLKWISKYYMNPEGLTLELFIPKTMSNKSGINSYSAIEVIYVDFNRELKRENLIVTPDQKYMVDFFFETGPVKLRDCPELGITAAKINTLAKKGYLLKFKKKHQRNITALYSEIDIHPTPPELNDDQQKVYSSISKNLTEHSINLIHGVTGSGKTRVYIRLINDVVSKGLQAVMLVPEIGLTPQIFREFYTYFGEKVIFYHGNLTQQERHEIWINVKNEKYNIVVGTRSALFLPFVKLGIIVIDEEHDVSYRQEERTPFYNTITTAAFFAKVASIPLVLASATPSIEMYEKGLSKKINLFSLNRRATEVQPPEIFFVNLTKVKSHSFLLSYPLLSLIGETLNANKKVILFFNRRGYFTICCCSDCETILNCPFCSCALVYHKKEESYKCHICGYSTGTIPPCQCGGKYATKGTGIQMIEEELIKLFPTVDIIRMDADEVRRKKQGHEIILSKFRDSEKAILLGTQMITKGHDIPRVGLAGMLMADSATATPDFRSMERGFQLMLQLIGRSGRETERGKAVIQTFDIENPIFEFIKKGDYISFYEHEKESRQKYNYPPFTNLCLITIVSSKEESTKKTSQKLYLMLTEYKKAVQEQFKHLEISQPYTPVFDKKENSYYMLILIKSPEIMPLNSFIKSVVASLSETEKKMIRIKIDPLSTN